MTTSPRNARDAIASLGGYISAVPTPFRADNGAIDEAAFTAFCDWQIAQGIAGLVVCGTTGEAPTLTAEEHHRLIRMAVDVAAGRVPVIAGVGSNATATAIGLTQSAEQAGADAMLAVVPYYNKPSQDGLFGHFEAIARTTRRPVILYDVPSRTGCSLAIDTVVRLADVPGIVGLKDASGDLARITRLRRRLGDSFRLFSGDDATALGFLAMGGDGCISVTANVAPTLCTCLHTAFASGDTVTARQISLSLSSLNTALFHDTNPVPLKAALAMMRHMSATVRPPLCEAGGETWRLLRSALAEVGVTLGNPGNQAGPRPHAIPLAGPGTVQQCFAM